MRTTEKSLQKRLLKASWEKYHKKSDDPETFYSILYLDGKGVEPVARLDRSILFLAVWNAWGPNREPGAARALEFLPKFLSENASTIRSLRGRSLLTLDDRDFANIGHLATQLDSGLSFAVVKEGGKTVSTRTPTAWGKLLHFLAPESILLWDSEYVRNGPLQLDDGPGDFVCLQRWGKRLLQHLENESRGSVPKMLGNHRMQTKGRYDEPVTKFLDEVMYDPEAVRLAISAIGEPYSHAVT